MQSVMNFSPLLLIFALVYPTGGIKVLRGSEKEGETCEIAEGVYGQCRTSETCHADGGTVRWNEVIKFCRQDSPEKSVICCRKPAKISSALCNSWKNYWRSNNGKCVSRDPLVVGGEEAKIGQFPEIAIVGVGRGTKYIWFCGGTLVSPHFVLTAAHCVIRSAPYFVRLGQHDLNVHDLTNISRIVGSIPIGLFKEKELHIETRRKAPVEQTIRIQRVIIHPEYEKPYNDIALLQLERSAVFTKRVLPACLPTHPEEDFSSYLMSLAGWGRLQPDKKDLSDTLQKVQIPIIEQKECAKYLSKRNSLSIPRGILIKQLCAGIPGKNSCKGDSGGPLVLQMKETPTSAPCEHTLAGIVSFGFTCGSLTIYTRVSSYLDWVTGYIAPKLLPIT